MYLYEREIQYFITSLPRDIENTLYEFTIQHTHTHTHHDKPTEHALLISQMFANNNKLNVDKLKYQTNFWEKRESCSGRKFDFSICQYGCNFQVAGGIVSGWVGGRGCGIDSGRQVREKIWHRSPRKRLRKMTSYASEPILEEHVIY